MPKKFHSFDCLFDKCVVNYTEIMNLSMDSEAGIVEIRRIFSKKGDECAPDAPNFAFAVSRRLMLLRLIGVFLGGAGYAAALPPLNASALAFVALTPLIAFASADGRGWKAGAFGGWLWGIGWSVFAFRFLREIDPAIPWLMAPVISLWPAAFGALLPALWRNLAYSSAAEEGGFAARRQYLLNGNCFARLLNFALTAAALFTLLEWTRSRLFPWNNLGVTMWRNLPFLQLAALTGGYGINFVVAFVNAAVFAAARCRFRNGGLAVLAFAAGVLALIHLGGAIRLRSAPEMRPNWFPALLQGDLSQRRNAGIAEAEEALDVYLALSAEAAAQIPRPDLIVWPESAVPVAFRAAHPAAEKFRAGVANRLFASSIPMLIGAIDFRLDPRNRAVGVTNSALYFSGDGRLRYKYDKIHRVPFGEYVPFRAWLPESLVRRIDMNRDLLPGVNVEPVPLGERVRAGIAICYEGIFSYLTREFALRGANVLVVLSNDAWYPASSEPEQHLANAVARAVETGLAMVRCGNNGGSLVVTPRGEITQILTVPGAESRPELRRGRGFRRVSVEVPEHPVKTFYLKHGEWFIAVLTMIVAAGCAAALHHAVRRRRRRIEIRDGAASAAKAE